MKHVIGSLMAVGLLAGCSQQAADNAQTKIQNALNVAYKDGQLFCSVATKNGPMVVGVINAAVTVAAPGAAPVALLVTGASASFVAAACASINGIPVSPPAVPTAVPAVAVVPPAA